MVEKPMFNRYSLLKAYLKKENIKKKGPCTFMIINIKRTMDYIFAPLRPILYHSPKSSSWNLRRDCFYLSLEMHHTFLA
jgi:hypothetical protein